MTSPYMPPLLRIQGLGVTLDGTRILEDLSFDIEPGDNLVIIGPNGSGKTVLLRALLGIVPHTGQLTWQSGIRVGYVPQKIDADRHLPLSTRDLLRVKARILSLPPSAAEAAAAAVDLKPQTLDTPVGQLSGGQFQKALIAFALLGDPSLLLFDEPTASLDQLAEEHVYELIQDLQKQRGMTVVVVSHDLSVVYRYATKVLCVNHRGICFGPPRQVLTPQSLEALYGKGHHHFDHHHAGES
jgi:zinc transport system ATP-binding protein